MESAENDGKWAEEDSDVSSVDEFDSVSIKGRREEFEARKALLLSERKTQDGGDSADLADGKLNNENSKEGGTKKTYAAKTKGSAPGRDVKKGKIRFKEEGKAADQRTGKNREKVTKKGKEEEEAKKDDASETGEPKEEKRNKYLDEWLGIKPKVVDTRYQPGKPPPNR